MKVAIIGAGISGLSQYLWLRKVGFLDAHSVIIYEARQAQDENTTAPSKTGAYDSSATGGGIGLSTTGLHVLERLDQSLYDEVLGTGHIIRNWRMSNARGWTLANMGITSEGEKMVMIGRDACCQVLRNRVPDEAVVHRKVVDIKLAEGSNKPALIFQDQTSEEFDFVIGCDGIWSRTRQAIFGAQGRDQYEFSPRYEGLVGVGGCVPGSMIKGTPDGEMNVVLGANGFFGYGYIAGQPGDSTKAGETALWWSTYSLRECPDDWRKIDKDDVRNELQKRHLGWQNTPIQDIVRDVKVDGLWPTFITPLLPTWEKGSCVLVGDAAHALQPSSGQGASMALEDCETLALLLHHYAQEDPVSGATKAAKQYSDLRRPRLDGVFKKAQQLAGMKQDMSVFQEMLMYFFVWLMAWLKVTENYNRNLNAYDVPTEVSNAIKRAE
ncbi:FAD/NAD(P)-binding domain-containing protein [Nemania sp. FL0916]|nr:FAD/NAD(P)-binding domain-containing protein [Nemania sp. FL0916]